MLTKQEKSAQQEISCEKNLKKTKRYVIIIRVIKPKTTEDFLTE